MPVGGPLEAAIGLVGQECRENRRLRALAWQCRFVVEVDAIVPSEAWERRMRCREANLKPLIGVLRVESPPGRA
jgi:hypothetical protein